LAVFVENFCSEQENNSPFPSVFLYEFSQPGRILYKPFVPFTVEPVTELSGLKKKKTISPAVIPAHGPKHIFICDYCRVGGNFSVMLSQKIAGGFSLQDPLRRYKMAGKHKNNGSRDKIKKLSRGHFIPGGKKQQHPPENQRKNRKKPL
jgi:hypothetical protein